MRKTGGSGTAAKKFRRDFVDHFIRALSGENGRDEKLVVIAMTKRNTDFRVGLS
jgi:hypothetical protein